MANPSKLISPKELLILILETIFNQVKTLELLSICYSLEEDPVMLTQSVLVITTLTLLSQDSLNHLNHVIKFFKPCITMLILMVKTSGLVSKKSLLTRVTLPQKLMLLYSFTKLHQFTNKLDHKCKMLAYLRMLILQNTQVAFLKLQLNKSLNICLFISMLPFKVSLTKTSKAQDSIQDLQLEDSVKSQKHSLSEKNVLLNNYKQANNYFLKC